MAKIKKNMFTEFFNYIYATLVENNELQMEADNYMGQKEALIHALNGELSKVQEVSNLIKFTNKAEMIDTFSEQIFNDYIEKIIVYSRVEIGFVLKCGITLRERM